MADSIVFVVRVWPGASRDDGFRALVRRVDREQTQSFVDPGELLCYLTRDPWTTAAAATESQPMPPQPQRPS